jgi:hypothetical protein
VGARARPAPGDDPRRVSHAIGGEGAGRLRFAIGPIPEPPATSETIDPPFPEPIDVPPEIASEAAAAAAEIDDDELRELVSRAARASLLRARSGRSFW